MFFVEDTTTEFKLVGPDSQATISVEDISGLYRALHEEGINGGVPVWIHGEIYGKLAVEYGIYEPYKPFPNYSIARFFDPDEEIQGRWNGYQCELVPMKEGVKSQLPRLEYKRAYVED